jgi:hypothetical protein
MDRLKKSRSKITWILLLVNIPGIIFFLHFASEVWAPLGQEGLCYDAGDSVGWTLTAFPLLAVCTLTSFLGVRDPAQGLDGRPDPRVPGLFRRADERQPGAKALRPEFMPADFKLIETRQPPLGARRLARGVSVRVGAGRKAASAPPSVLRETPAIPGVRTKRELFLDFLRRLWHI